MLTQQQIVDITSLCKTMGVKYYDVQLELVDHIAGMIDHLQEENAQLNFEDALQLAIKEFTPSEFKLIVKNKEQQLLKRFKRLWLKKFIAYFTFPKIMLTFLLVVLVVFIEKYFNLEDLYNLAMYFPITIAALNIYLFRKEKIWDKIKNSKIKVPLLSYSVLLTRNNFMLGASYTAYLLTSCIPGLLFSVGLIKYTNVTRHVVYENLYSQVILYSYPIYIIICLAWRKVFVGQTTLMRKQYSAAFGN